MKNLRNEIEVIYKSSFLYSKRLLKKWALPSNDHKIKSDLVTEFRKLYNIKILVETGTYLGEMIYDQLSNFEQIHSIELSEYYYRIARKRFRKNSQVKLYLGDSAIILDKVVEEINTPALFWLDGHYSGGKTSKGKSETPLMDELKIIFNKLKSPIILIDDARYILDKKNYEYPDMNDIKAAISNASLKFNIEIKGDIICLFPTEFEGQK